MDIYLEKNATYEDVLEAIQEVDVNAAVCCTEEAIFTLAKEVLVKEKQAGVTVQLVDEQGFAVRQVTSKTPEEDRPTDCQLSTRQAAVVRALEKVLLHCKKEGVQLVGYSDELVAMPMQVDPEDVSPAVALDVETFGVYRGADAIIK